VPRSLAAALLLLLAPFASTDDALAKKIEAITDGPDYTQAHWGLLVVDANTGRTVYARNAEKLFTPASVTKLFSCAAALVAVGPDTRVSTPVYARGERDGGRLKGDLILVAKGDLTFGGRTDRSGKVVFKDGDHIYANGSDAELTDTDPLHALNSLAEQVRAAGITAVEGDVLVDDRLFEMTRGTGSGPAAVSPVVVNDNLIDVTIEPGAKEGDPARVTFRPETGCLRADVDVVTGPKDSKPAFSVPSDDLLNLVIRGSVPAGGKKLLRIVPVNQPTAFARALFIEALRRHGVRVTAPLVHPPGHAVALPDRSAFAAFEPVAAYMSPKFRETIRVTLKVSHNLYASALPCLVAAKRGGRTLARGLAEQGKILKEIGVDSSLISFGGGAGGANADKVSPRATVALLQGMRKRPEWEAFRAGFPVLGVDGTLATVVPADSPAKGKVFAKTGTMYWDDGMNDRTMLTSKALGGVMTTKAGTELVFAVFVNDVPLPKGVATSREGKALGKICEVIYEHGP
jgi:D-alanyl-D-alanine carboxypeptidase/D-alanyl-D-alanine-endopeptidase (penicillin-binding protein 4)